MKTFIVLRTDYPMEVHAAGCADLRGKKARRYDQDWKAMGETIDAVITELTADMNHDFETTYAATDLFRVMPCCKGGAR